jgi:LPXTG-motif cell wall-anchored protein
LDFAKENPFITAGGLGLLGAGLMGTRRTTAACL